MTVGPPTTPQRSRMMAAVGRESTPPEMEVRRRLHAAGFRFITHARHLPGSPDVVLPRHRLVVFVHGCFWHGHSCRAGHVPKTHTDFWTRKRDRNRRRDRRVVRVLRRDGWRVFTIWECRVDVGVGRVLTALRGGS